MSRVRAKDIEIYKELRKGEWEVTGELRYVLKYTSREDLPPTELYERIRRLILRHVYGHVVERLVGWANRIGHIHAAGWDGQEELLKLRDEMLDLAQMLEEGR